jgi:hypothetical protein
LSYYLWYIDVLLRSLRMGDFKIHYGSTENGAAKQGKDERFAPKKAKRVAATPIANAARWKRVTPSSWRSRVKHVTLVFARLKEMTLEVVIVRLSRNR